MLYRNTRESCPGRRTWSNAEGTRLPALRELFFVLHPRCLELRTLVGVLRHQCPVLRQKFPALQQYFSCCKTQVSCCEHFRRKAEIRGRDVMHDIPESRHRIPEVRNPRPGSREDILLLRD